MLCLQTAVLEAESPEMKEHIPDATVQKAKALAKNADVLCKLGKEFEATKAATKTDLKKMAAAKTVADEVKKIVERLHDIMEDARPTT